MALMFARLLALAGAGLEAIGDQRMDTMISPILNGELWKITIFNGKNSLFLWPCSIANC